MHLSLWRLNVGRYVSRLTGWACNVHRTFFISLEVLINQPPPMPEAVAKIRYFCVSSIKSLISTKKLE